MCDSHTPNSSSSYRQAACLLSRHGTIWTAQLASGASGYIHQTGPMVTYEQEDPASTTAENESAFILRKLYLLATYGRYILQSNLSNWYRNRGYADNSGLSHLRVYRYATCRKLHRGLTIPQTISGSPGSLMIDVIVSPSCKSSGSVRKGRYRWRYLAAQRYRVW